MTRKFPIILVILIFSFISCLFAYMQVQAQNKQIKTLRGQISQIDWVASTITVRWLATEGYVSYDEVTFFVPDSTRIVKEGASVALTDLQVQDSVIVEYLDTSPGPLKAISLTVVTA
ncbi:MAG: hypothetical protein KJ818_06060 [Candidatus Omnitrophica bacterium]|nr:hypothetical protein [Candidatus Omnitrophota bacterium]